MSDDEIKIKISAQIDELKASMNQVGVDVKAALDKVSVGMQQTAEVSKKTSQDVQDSNKKISNSFASLQGAVDTGIGGITGALGKLRSHFAALMALLAGGAMFEKSIKGAIEWDLEADKLSKKLGITTEKASELNTALRLVGTDSGAYLDLFARLERQMRTNAATIEKLGVDVVDLHTGKMRPGISVMEDVRKELNKYEIGINQDAVAAGFFGGKVQDVGAVLKLTGEQQSRGTEVARDWGLVVGKDNVKAAKDYKEELANLKLAFTGLERQLGEFVMPKLETLAGWLNAEGRSAVQGFGDIVVWLAGLMMSLAGAAQIVGIYFKALKETPGAIAHDIGTSISDFGAILDSDGGKPLNQVTSGAISEYRTIQDAAEASAKRINDTFDKWYKKFSEGPPPPRAISKGSGLDEGRKGEQAPDWLRKEGQQDKGAGSDTSFIEETKTELEGLKALEENWFTWSQERELEYWQGKVKLAAEQFGEYSKEWYDAMGEVGKLQEHFYKQEVEYAKKADESKKKIAQDWSRYSVEHEQSMYELQKSAVEAQVELGRISEDEGLRLQKEMLDQRYQNQLAALQNDIELLKQNPLTNPEEMEKIYIKMRQLTDKYWGDQRQLEQKNLSKSAQTWKAAFDQIGSSVSSALKGVITGSQTLMQGLQGILDAILGAFIDMVAKWIAKWVWAHTFAKLFGSAMGVAEVATNAAVGASAAGASVAAIPMVGWTMVPAVMAQTYALLMSMAPAAAAEGGWWDVPGMPITQLHPEEMVLPAQEARGLRDMVKGGGGGDVHLHIGFLDTRGAERWLKSNKKELFRVIKEGHRDGHLRPDR